MTLIGSKKGQGGQQKPHIQKDTTASTSIAKMLFGLCEGEIAGLADGAKSIKLNGTPLMNANGQMNFSGVKYDFRAGTLDQTHISGFPAIESETGVNVELRSDRAWVKAITDTQLSAVRVRLMWNSLREQKDNGDVVAYRIAYAIDVQTDGGAFVTALESEINDKASSGYKRSHRIELPRAKSGWTIRVRRLTPNRNSDLIGDTMYIDAITNIIDAKLNYRGTAMLGIQYDAETFSNIAKMAVRLKGKIIQVPTNYNPETRQYVGMWDGSFKMAYSNNPAWVFYDLCTAKRYGLGDRLNGLVDKWSLYVLGQYCDEMVDDGNGGKEPRFTCNVYIQKAESAFRLLQNLSSIFRAMCYWNGEQIVVDADIPKDPVYTFSRANVVGGRFSYSGTSKDERHSLAIVSWDNPENDYKTEQVPVQDQEAMSKLGINRLEINAFGCTSLGQAQRAGEWAIRSEQLETRQVAFSCGLDGFIPQIGQIINIADDIFAGRAISGRVVSVSSNRRVVSVDRAVSLPTGSNKLILNLADGSTGTYDISSVSVKNNISDITLNTPVAPTSDGAIWAIQSPDLHLMQFRVMSIKQNDDNTFDISALQYEPNKFRAVDGGARVKASPISAIKVRPIQAPAEVGISAKHRTVQGQSVTTMTIDWSQVDGAVAYMVEWRKDDNSWMPLHKIVSQSVDIDGVYSGKYQARVRAVDAFGNESMQTLSAVTVVAGKVGKPTKLARLIATGGLFSMKLGWDFGSNSEDVAYTEIQVSPDGRANISLLGTFAYPTNNHEINGLQGNLVQFYRGRVVDKSGNISDWSAWAKGTVSSDPEKVLDILSGHISETHLDQSLRAPIAKIPTIESSVGAMGNRVSSLESSVVGANGLISGLRSELNTAKNTLQTAVSNITTERNRISTAIRDITVLQSANNAKTVEIANLTQTVGNHTSSIRDLAVTTGDLSQKYSQIKTVADKATSDITQIKQTQAGQATSIERLGAKFDSLSVGGRNLLLNTKKLTPHWLGLPTIANGVATLIATGRLHGMHHPSAIIQALDDGKVTISFFAKSNKDGRLHIRLRRQNINNQISDIAQYVMIDSREFKRYSLTLDYAKWDNQQRVNFEIVTYEAVGFVCEVKLPKLEIGTIPTDWTSAPEDTQADIDTAKTQAEANINTVRETLTNADIALSQRIDSLTADYNGNKSSVASQLKTLSDKDKATASQISQITANVTNAQNKADTASHKADTANTNAQNAKRVADDALGKANTAKADIIAERQARADAESGLARQMSALDSKFTNADNAIRASVAQAQQTASNAQQAVATAQSQLNAKFDDLSSRGRVRANLLPNGGFEQGLLGWTGSTPFVVSEHPSFGRVAYLDRVVGKSGTFTLISDKIPCEAGRGYVISCDSAFNGTRCRMYCDIQFYNAQGRVILDGNQAPFDGVHDFTVVANRHEAYTQAPQGTTHMVARFVVENLSGGTYVAVRQIKIETGHLPSTPYTPDTLGKNLSAKIDEFKQTQATKDTATAQKLSQLESGLGAKANTTALNSLTTKVNRVDGKLTAEAKKVSQLQTTVNGQTTSIRNVEQSVNGVKAIKAVTVDNNGFISGYGLMSELQNGRVTSSFGINADQIYFGATKTAKKPFIFATRPTTIDGVSYPAGAWFNSVYIANSSINMLHIADSIQSDNYVQGRSGWRLFKNGTIEINSTFGDGTKIQLTSRGLVGFYANGRKAFELGHFL